MGTVIEQLLTGPVLSGHYTLSSTSVLDVDYAALPTDQVIAYTTLTADRTVTLTPCGGAQNYKYWQIKDKSGNCSAIKRIILASTSGLFDGLSTTAISTAVGSKTFYDDGTNFFMVGAFMPSVNASSSIQKADGNGGMLNAVAGTDYLPPTAITRTVSSLTLSLVGTGATGTQISTTKDATVRCTVSTSITSTIGGPATSLVILKTCATNSATESDWVEVGRLETDQTITLAIALQSTNVGKGQICGDLPAGFWVKLVNSGTGTHSEAYVTGQKTIYG